MRYVYAHQVEKIFTTKTFIVVLKIFRCEKCMLQKWESNVILTWTKKCSQFLHVDGSVTKITRAYTFLHAKI